MESKIRISPAAISKEIEESSALDSPVVTELIFGKDFSVSEAKLIRQNGNEFSQVLKLKGEQVFALDIRFAVHHGLLSVLPSGAHHLGKGFSIGSGRDAAFGDDGIDQGGGGDIEGRVHHLDPGRSDLKRA